MVSKQRNAARISRGVSLFGQAIFVTWEVGSASYEFRVSRLVS